MDGPRSSKDIDLLKKVGGKRSTRASAVFVELRREIISGQLPPGCKIKTVALSNRLGVGLSPVREALNRLLSQGLIRQTDRRGFSVMPVSEDELADITATRCWCDGTALTKSIELGDERWEETVLVRYHRLKRTPRLTESGAGDSRDWDAAHKSFHMGLLEACDSDWLLKFCDQIFEASERYRHLGGLANNARSRTEEEHQAIMQATIDRRTEDAVRLLTAHYQKTLNHLSEVLEKFAKKLDRP